MTAPRRRLSNPAQVRWIRLRAWAKGRFEAYQSQSYRGRYFSQTLAARAETFETVLRVMDMEVGRQRTRRKRVKA